MIISDGSDGDRGLPTAYGVDDLPLVLQDKRFGRGGALVYDPDMMDLMHGFQGDTLVVNGAIGPVARVPAGYVRLRLLNAANARVFDLRFSDRRPFFVIAGDGGLLAEPVEVRRLVVAPAERYEVLVDFTDGRAVDLVTAPDAGHGPGMMMPMMGARRQGAGTTETFMRFETDPALKAAVTRLPRQLATLAPPDVKSSVAWRTFELNPMMGMGGMMGMGMMHGPGQGARSAHMMGINGRSYGIGST
jgi:cuproxidase